MKTADDFKKAAAERHLTKWNIHECSICGAPVGFIFRGDSVYFDSGCDCAQGDLRESDWQEVAECYNRNAGANDVLARMAKYPAFREHVEETNMFWVFDSIVSVAK